MAKSLHADALVELEGAIKVQRESSGDKPASIDEELAWVLRLQS